MRTMVHNIFLATDKEGLARAAFEDGRWQVSTHLREARIHCLAKDPNNPRRVYAGTRRLGVLCSEDGGQTWRPIGLEGTPVKALAVDPQRPDVLYAGSKPVSLYRTSDRGAHWEELPALRAARRWWWFSPAEPPGLLPYVQAISVSPEDSSVLVCGIEFGALMISVDSGTTWSGHKKGALRDCHSARFHCRDPRWVYEGGAGGGGGAYSRDGGNTWQRAGAGASAYGWNVAADPERPDIWYLSASRMPSLLRGEFEPPAHRDGRAGASIYRSADGGPLEKLSGGLPEPLDYMAYALEIDPSAPGHLVAGLANGDVWHTENYGDTWRQLPFTLGGIHRDMVVLG